MRKQHFCSIIRTAAPKNGRTFCLDKRFSCFIVVEMFVTLGVFFNCFQIPQLKGTVMQIEKALINDRLRV